MILAFCLNTLMEDMNEDNEVTQKRRGRPPKTAEDDQKLYPESITLIRPFGYIQDNGQGRAWFQGMVVDDADEIKDMIDRGFKDWK